MAAVRLRKAFRYPEDSDAEYDRDELDEEEQEQVIKQLRMLNSKRNAGYSMAFAVIPLVSAATFVPSMLSQSSTLYERFLCLLGVLSLAATAYVMKHLPLQQRPDGRDKSPLAGDWHIWSFEYLVPINATVCTLLALVYCFIKVTETPCNVRPALYVLPGVMLVAIVVARKVMLSVDLTSLEDLRYEYKGV